GGPRARQARQRVTVRLALPCLLAVLLLVFIRALEAVEIPILLRVPAAPPLLTTEIYLPSRGGPGAQDGEASAYAILLVLLVVGLLCGYRRLALDERMFASLGGGARRAGVRALGRWRYPCGALLLLLPCLLLAPLAALG